ncbi:MAG: PTS system fructose-specific EIIABC component [Phycisphaerae bacterium]|nr:PTS system fructose-specific EIIABC component [Phycisphaerae bacterium]
MKLSDILSPECILVPLPAADKVEAITLLVRRLVEAGKCTDEEKVRQVVLEREAIRSTGIGKGLAVPHGKCTCCKQLIMALGKPQQPINFDSRDGEPARLIALLVSPPDQTGPHIQALARISRLMLIDQFRKALDTATTPEEIYQIIAHSEL